MLGRSDEVTALAPLGLLLGMLESAVRAALRLGGHSGPCTSVLEHAANGLVLSPIDYL